MGPAKDWLLSPIEIYPAGTTVAVILPQATNYYIFDKFGEARVMPRIDVWIDVPVNAWHEAASCRELCRVIPEDLDRGSTLHRLLVRAALRTAYHVLPWWEDSNPDEKYVREALDATKRWVVGTDWHGAGESFYTKVRRAEYNLSGNENNATASITVTSLPALDVLSCVLSVRDVVLQKKQSDALHQVHAYAETSQCSKANPMRGPLARQSRATVEAQQLDQLRALIPLREVLTEHAFRLPRLRETP